MSVRSLFPVLRQPVGEHAARRPRAHDHVAVLAGPVGRRSGEGPAEARLALPVPALLPAGHSGREPGALGDLEESPLRDLVYGCQMVKAKYLDCICFALRA